MMEIPFAVLGGITAWKVLDNRNPMIQIKVQNRVYTVRKYEDEKISRSIAQDLHKLTIKIEKLIKHLRKNFSNNEKVMRLVNSYRGNIQEIDFHNEGQVGYNVNKGEVIGLCMYKDGQYLDLNTIMFVLLHELSHSMTIKYSHNSNFWKNFEFILQEGINIGIYTYEDFFAEPKMHCGMKISHSPVS